MKNKQYSYLVGFKIIKFHYKAIDKYLIQWYSIYRVSKNCENNLAA